MEGWVWARDQIQPLWWRIHKRNYQLMIVRSNICYTMGLFNYDPLYEWRLRLIDILSNYVLQYFLGRSMFSFWVVEEISSNAYELKSFSFCYEAFLFNFTTDAWHVSIPGALSRFKLELSQKLPKSVLMFPNSDQTIIPIRSRIAVLSFLFLFVFSTANFSVHK